MKKLMEETVDRWHEMEYKEKVVVLDKVCESAGI